MMNVIYTIVATLLVLLILVASNRKSVIFGVTGLLISISSVILITLYYILYDYSIVHLILEYYQYGIEVLFIGLLLFYLYNNQNKSRTLYMLDKGMKNSRFNVYYVTDRKDRIKDISSSLLEELGLIKEEVLGRNLYSVINERIRIQKLNGVEINNRNLESYYEETKLKKKNYSEKEELLALNTNGEEVVLILETHYLYRFHYYMGRVAVGEKRKDFDAIYHENTLSNKEEDLNSTTDKLVALFEVSDDGYFVVDIDSKDLWVSDVLRNNLNLPGNNMNWNDIFSRMNKEDLLIYQRKIYELTKSDCFYNVTYRLSVRGTEHFFREKGKKIFNKNGSQILGTIFPIKSNHFMRSDVEILDEMASIDMYYGWANKLLRENKYFQVMLVRLENIPKINMKYGREVGNMVMAEFLLRLKEMFITESGGVYRLSGLDFIYIISDERKMGILSSNRKETNKFLDVVINYGSISNTITAKAGIASVFKGASENKLLDRAIKALQYSLNNEKVNSINYYEELYEQE